MAETMQDLAERVSTALDAGDLDAYGDLLAPDVHWGPPDSPQWGCHNRVEVLKWYRKARGKGMRATVTEVVAGSDHLLVGLTVGGRRPAGDDGLRWQVLTVKDGLIADICGFDTREEAVARAGMAREGS